MESRPRSPTPARGSASLTSAFDGLEADRAIAQRSCVSCAPTSLETKRHQSRQRGAESRPEFQARRGLLWELPCVETQMVYTSAPRCDIFRARRRVKEIPPARL